MRFNSIMIVTGILTLLVIIILGIISGKEASGSPIPQYEPSDQERPRIEITENRFDLGRMRVDEKREKEVILKNTGTAPLVLSNFSTSCDCTFIQMLYQGVTSEQFSMHSNSAWQGTVAPGTEATIRVIYDPSIMPVAGSIERSAYFSTNDPDQKQIMLYLTAFVE
ncbi:MAG: hypothetical protein BWY68_00074 [bacterium ADurb.Bin400]|nr:MAG: hypothetical protein BWY68_00074 [bacterium ADurb.Bin400]